MTIAHNLLSQKQCYKQLIKQKKTEIKAVMAFPNPNITTKNPILFRSITTGHPSNGPLHLKNYILREVWENHFNELYRGGSACSINPEITKSKAV